MRRARALRRIRYNGATFLSFSAMNSRFAAIVAPLRDLLRYRDRPELFALLIYQAITTTGFTLLMPLVSVHFVADVDMAAATVGMALALRQISQQGLTFIGGMLADRYGLKPVLCTGLIIRAVGFFMLGYATAMPTFFTALLLTGLGGALFDAPFQAATVAMTQPQERREFYLLANYLSGIAATIGPLLAIALLLIDFSAVGVAAGLCFLTNVFVALRYFPNTRPSTTSDGDDTPQLRRLLRDRIYLRFVAIMCGYWFVVTQVNISFPLLAESLTGSQSSAGWFYTFSSVLTLVLQYFLVRRLQRHFASHQLLITGTLIMTCGTFFLGTSSNFAFFLLWVACYTCGYLISRPMIDILVAHLAHPRALGLYVGISNISIGLGGGLGNFLGGWLYDLGKTYHLPLLPWSVFGLPPGNWRCISAAIPRPSRSKRLFQEKRRKRGRQAFAHGKAGDLFAHGRDEFEAVSAKAAQNEDARVFGVQADNEVFRRGAVVAAHFAVTQRARLREVLLQEAVCVAPVVIVAVRIALGCCPHDFATVVAPHFEAITAIREAVVDAIGRFRGKAREAVAFLIGRRHVVPGEGFAYRGKRQLESESGDVIRPSACTQGDAVRMVVLRATFGTQ